MKRVRRHITLESRDPKTFKPVKDFRNGENFYVNYDYIFSHITDDEYGNEVYDSEYDIHKAYMTPKEYRKFLKEEREKRKAEEEGNTEK